MTDARKVTFHSAKFTEGQCTADVKCPLVHLSEGGKQPNAKRAQTKAGGNSFGEFEMDKESVRAKGSLERRTAKKHQTKLQLSEYAMKVACPCRGVVQQRVRDERLITSFDLDELRKDWNVYQENGTTQSWKLLCKIEGAFKDAHCPNFFKRKSPPTEEARNTDRKVVRLGAFCRQCCFSVHDARSSLNAQERKHHEKRILLNRKRYRPCRQRSECAHPGARHQHLHVKLVEDSESEKTVTCCIDNFVLLVRVTQ